MISSNSESLPVAGELYTLTCTATVDEFLQANLTLTWSRLESDGDVLITGHQLSKVNSILSFNLLTTSHGGMYVCETAVTINGHVLLIQTTNESLYVQSKLQKKVKKTKKRFLGNYFIYSSTSIDINQSSHHSLQWNYLHFNW